LELESLCSVAAGVRFICLGDEHLGKGIVGALIPKQYQDNRIGGKIVVEKFAALWTNSIVMPGLTVSESSVVGANSLLRENTDLGQYMRDLRQSQFAIDRKRTS